MVECIIPKCNSSSSEEHDASSIRHAAVLIQKVRDAAVGANSSYACGISNTTQTEGMEQGSQMGTMTAQASKGSAAALLVPPSRIADCEVFQDPQEVDRMNIASYNLPQRAYPCALEALCGSSRRTQFPPH